MNIRYQNFSVTRAMEIFFIILGINMLFTLIGFFYFSNNALLVVAALACGVGSELFNSKNDSVKIERWVLERLEAKAWFLIIALVVPFVFITLVPIITFGDIYGSVPSLMIVIYTPISVITSLIVMSKLTKYLNHSL